MLPQTYCLICSLGTFLSYRWTKGNELIIELKIKQAQIPEIVKDARIALRYLWTSKEAMLHCQIAFLIFTTNRILTFFIASCMHFYWLLKLMFTKFKALNDGDFKYKWNDFQFEIQLLMSIYFLIRVSGLFILSLNEIHHKNVFVCSAPNSLIGSEWFLLQPFNTIKTGMKMENAMQHSKSVINNNFAILIFFSTFPLLSY